MPRSAITRTAVGMQRLGVAAGAAGLDRAARALFEKRFGHLRAGTVARAQEQHPRGGPWSRCRGVVGGKGAEAQSGLQGCAGGAQQFSAAGHIDPVVGVAAVGGAPPRRHQAGPAQLAEMVGDQVLLLATQLGELTHSAVAAGQLDEQLPALGIAHQLQETERRQVANVDSHCSHITSGWTDASTPACLLSRSARGADPEGPTVWETRGRDRRYRRDQDGRCEERRSPVRREPDQPRPAVVRRGGGHQARPRRLSRWGGRPDSSRPRGPCAVGDPGPPGPGGVHAEERPQVRPRVGPDRDHVGGELEAGSVVRLVQRPPHAAVVRRTSGRWSTTRPWCGWTVPTA